MLIGYARISTPDQSMDLQFDALKSARCEKIFTDTVSGSKASRPGLDEALAFVRTGDILVVWKLDRLGRSLNHLVRLMETLDKRGVSFKSLSDCIDTTTPMGKMTFGIFGSLSEFELSLMKERTLAGLKAARARGRNGGRKRTLKREQIDTMLTLYESGKHSIIDICKQMQISRKSFYNYLGREKNEPSARHNSSCFDRRMAGALDPPSNLDSWNRDCSSQRLQRNHDSIFQGQLVDDFNVALSKVMQR